MSKSELLALLAQLGALTRDLRDLQWSGETPQHVVASTDQHINAITDASRELAKLHGVSAP